MENLYLLLSFHSKNTYIAVSKELKKFWPMSIFLSTTKLYINQYMGVAGFIFRPLNHLCTWTHLLLSDLIAVLLNYLCTTPAKIKHCFADTQITLQFFHTWYERPGNSRARKLWKMYRLVVCSTKLNNLDSLNLHQTFWILVWVVI